MSGSLKFKSTAAPTQLSKMKAFILTLAITAASAYTLPEWRVVNGTDAPLGKYPQLISLQNYNSHSCGGTILNENFFMTAAHCVQTSTTYLKALAGTNALDQGGTLHQAVQIITHEAYDPLNQWINDIAVVKVDPPFVFDEYTQAVVLPAQDQESAAGSTGTLVGWGLSETGGLIMNIQQEVDLVVYSDEECDAIHGGRPHPTNICAGVIGGGKGQCSGDSGGPLFVNGYQAGIVSWSRKPCTIAPYPGVYTEVSPYVDWLLSKIN
ncbi:chymotrypsin-1-like [Neocloeon triangulifer]|uniref:chymotrypsin-1-like n=1 Tax=Neocloeon triangulifer TaxID=2078957 RepID=UPI00286F364E|nr:chymotrypsin-1-like [Neocloeon triangulifer]